MPIFRSEIARKSIAKRKGVVNGGPDCLPLLRGGASAKTHSLLCHHTRQRNGLDSRVLTCRCSVPNLGPRSSPFLVVMHGREEAYCRRIATLNLADAARTTVHNSLPDCRGFKTRATRSRGRLGEREIESFIVVARSIGVRRARKRLSGTEINM